MRHRVKGKKLSRKRGHRRELIKNLVTSLILYEKIITTLAKGRVIKAETEKILGIGKRGDLHSRRLILSRLNSKLAVVKIFEDLNEKFKHKKSGFVRLIKINNRKGDNSSQAMVELLIKHKEEDKKRTEKKAKDKIKTSKKEETKKPGFWNRLKSSGTKTKEVKTLTKKTIERTTSK